MAIKKRPDGWWYPWIFVAGFLVVLVVNGIMLFAATSTFSGLSVEKSFEKGNAYNAEIAAANAQVATGWQGAVRIVDIRAIGDENRKVRVAFDIRDREGQPLRGLTVRATVERPTVRGYDQDVTLVADETHGYLAEIALPMKGQWEIRLRADRRGDPTFRLRERLQIP